MCCDFRVDPNDEEVPLCACLLKWVGTRLLLVSTHGSQYCDGIKQSPSRASDVLEMKNNILFVFN